MSAWHSHLNLGLLLTSSVIITLPNTLSDLTPEIPALKFGLGLEWANGDLFLGTVDVCKCRTASFHVCGCVPLSVYGVFGVRGTWWRNRGLDGVDFAGEVAFALVLELNVLS